MTTNRRFERWAAAAGLSLLWVLPGASSAQGEPPAAARPPPGHMSIVPDSKLKHVDPMDDFSGVNFTTEQKAQVEQIRERNRSRMHDVAVDTKLSPEQRAAMLEGIQRLERGEVYRVLRPEQQTEVRKRVLARQQAAQKEKQKEKERLAQPRPQLTPTPQQPSQQSPPG